jgi:hypothetical protein
MNEEGKGQHRDSDEMNFHFEDGVEGNGTGEQRSEPATSLPHQKPVLTSLQPSQSTIPMRPVAVRQPQTTASQTCRKDKAPPNAGQTDTNKPFSVARVPRSAIDNSGLASNAAVPQPSSANIVRRKRDKV